MGSHAFAPPFLAFTVLATVAVACGPHAPAPSAPVASVAAPCPANAAGRLRFRVTFAGGVGDAAVRGRLLVAMTTLPDVPNPFRARFRQLQDIWTAGVDVQALRKGDAVELDPDLLASPKAFSLAPAGKYRIAARLVRGDASALVGATVERPLDPAHEGTVDLALDAAEPTASLPPDTDGVKIVHVESKLLSAFYGRPMTVDAAVSLPPSYGIDKARRYATEYYVPGFGGRLAEIAQGLGKSRQIRIDAHYPELVRVILPGTVPSGHHVFADSVNDGPWGSALVTEIIPALEKQFALAPSPRSRFLAGQSSGGWSSLWLLIKNPEFFGGAWATAPDPVDFRSFTRIDVTPGSTDNLYRNKDGSPRMLVRMDGRDALPFEQYARLEAGSGEVGALGTFDWVFSPRGPLGTPMRLFDPITGEQDPRVQKAWEKWDIHKVLDAGWATLGPKLKGKLHLFVGDADTFHLDDSVRLLCDFLKSKGSDAVCEVHPGKDHFTLTGDSQDPKSLTWRIEHEMAAVAGVK